MGLRIPRKPAPAKTIVLTSAEDLRDQAHRAFEDSEDRANREFIEVVSGDLPIPLGSTRLVNREFSLVRETNPATSPVTTDKIALARSKGLTAVDWANSLEVVSDADFETAASFLSKTVKLGLSWWDQIRDPGIARAKKLLDDSRAEKKADVQPFLDAEVIIKKKMGAWVATKAEQARLAASRERARRQEEAERQAEEEARLLAEQGDEEAAAEIYEDLAEGRIESAISVPELVGEKPKAAATTVKMVSKWTMVDRTKVNPSFMIPDEKAIGRVVRSGIGKAAEEVVGKGSIRVWEEAEIGSRAAVGSGEDDL